MQSTDKPPASGPHDEFELAAYDRVSSPPPEQVVKGMAEQEGLGGVSPKVFPEIKEKTGVHESLQTVDFATYIGKVVGAAAGNYKQLAIDHKAFFDKTIAESDDINKGYFDSLKLSQKAFFTKQAEAFKAFDEKLDTMTRLTQVVIKLTRGEGAKASAPEIDRGAVEAAAYAKGFKQAKANDVKARKSMATQIRNLRLQLQEKGHQPPDEDIQSISDGPEEGAAETAEEYRERKEREKERQREKKAEAREEHKDGEWDPRFKPISIPAKRPRPTPVAPTASSSSSSSSSAFSSSSAAGAGAFHAPGAPKKQKLKVYCEECQADKEEACVCEEDE
jgi:hypothetical protein